MLSGEYTVSIPLDAHRPELMRIGAMHLERDRAQSSALETLVLRDDGCRLKGKGRGLRPADGRG